ncbi:hypothetical protein D3C73_790510 [compost metagenome]
MTRGFGKGELGGLFPFRMEIIYGFGYSGSTSACCSPNGEIFKAIQGDGLLYAVKASVLKQIICRIGFLKGQFIQPNGLRFIFDQNSEGQCGFIGFGCIAGG